MKLDKAIKWSGQHNNLSFEIVHWGVERASSHSLNNGKGCWNYYVYLSESKIENFSSFWLEQEIKEFSVGGTKYLHCDYYNSPLSDVYWHGGVTLWEPLNERLLGQRIIKIGCDYSHLFDQENGYDYTLEDVYSDCIHTIEELQALLVFKNKKNQNG